MKAIFTYLIIPAVAATALADDDKHRTIMPGEFVIHQSITATALPREAKMLSIEAKAWTAFEITDLVEHGSMVKKGDVLIAFDAEGLEKAVVDLQKTLDRRAHEIAAIEQEIRMQRESAEDRLERARKAAKHADETYRYEVDVRQALDMATAKQAIRNAENRLRNANEELVQLKRMYEADDLVEETEEIILTRARENVEAAEVALRAEQAAQTRQMEYHLPRRLESLLEEKIDRARKLAGVELEVPRNLALKELELMQLETVQDRDREQFLKLEADRAMLRITAPTDGIFYHGVIEHGQWTAPVELARALTITGRPPVNRPIAVLVPSGSTIDLHARLTESAAHALGNDSLKGLAMVTGRSDLSASVSLESLKKVPDTERRYHAVFKADWPKSVNPVPGTTAEIHVLVYFRENAITVPLAALDFGPDGWRVRVKLADGTTQSRLVVRGRTHHDQVEILKGLEPGQVVVLR